MRTAALLLALAIFSFVPAIGSAAIITFETERFGHIDLNGPNVAGFTYTATGMGRELETFFGNPDAATAALFKYEGSVIANSLDIVRKGEGPFIFNSIDWRPILDLGSDQACVKIAIEGNAVSALHDFALSSVDRLTITVVDVAVTLEPGPGIVPEPTSMAIWGLGALGCAFASYRRWKRI